MNLNRLFYTSVLCSVMIFSACQPSSVVNQSVSFNTGNMSNVKSIEIISQVNRVNLGKTVKLSVLVKYNDGTSDSAVYWKSSDERVATVSPDGNLLAIRNGKVTITATAQKAPENKINIDILVE